MICIVALVVFAVLAVFSAKYRPLAAEAFDCVFRRVTFRPCHSGLDKRLKAKISGSLMKRNRAAGRFLFKYFEVFSWLFLILLVLSLVQVGISTYNVVVYGNCNGPNDDSFCIFDPLGGSQVSESDVCMANGATPQTLSVPDLAALGDHPRTGSASASVTVIEFGCYACPNTARQAPAVKRLIEEFGADIQFVYADFPLPNHAFSTEAAQAAHCVARQDSLLYWRYHFLLFDRQASLSEENLVLWAGEVGADVEAFSACMANPAVREEIEGDVAVGSAAGLYGTPTFFINSKPFVGVQSYRFLKGRIQAALEE